MEYHYQDICMPAEHLLSESTFPDPYAQEYASQYLMPDQGDAEYAVRNSVLVDGGDRFSVSSVVFDKFEELVWMGNQGGHVTSYYGPSLQKYTSFQIHESEEVRDILTTEQGIYALTKSTLRHQIRRGLPKFTHRSKNMQDMQCIFEASKTNLMMGGHQSMLLNFDITKKKETVISIPEDGCAVLRSGGGSLLACGSATGSVTLRDVRCPGKTEHTFKAHTACLSDLDMQGNLLITCGFTQVSGVAQPEPYVVVWDVRKLRAKDNASPWSAQTRSVPLLLHFLPAFSGRAVAAAGDGLVTLLHVNSHSDSANHSVFQVDTQNSQCSVMDVAASSQALVFGDQSGHIHLFSPQHNHEPVFNSFSRATEFADPVPEMPFVSITDTTFQFSSVALPSLVSGDKWFNELPADFYKKMYRKPKPIDPEVLKSMKMQGPIGYAPNPGTFRRNQMPYVEDNLEDLKSSKSSDSKLNTQPIPRHYQKLDLRYNKHGPNDDLEHWNKTGLPGIEATLPNSYCNSMLQVLYYTPAVKAIILAHTCAKEFCLSCELGFLFRMLECARGASCQAVNFQRAFRTVPEAAALGLILPPRHAAADVVLLIQSWNRFILHQMHYEMVETRKKEKGLAVVGQNANSPQSARGGNVAQQKVRNLATSPEVNGHFDDYNYSELEFLGPTEFDTQDEAKDGNEAWQKISQDEGNTEGQPTAANESMELPSTHSESDESEIYELFAIGRHQLNKCLKCNKEEERESVVLACALQYPPPGSKETTDRGFIQLLVASLASRRSTPAWCETCRRFSPTLQRATAHRLPPILAINCGGVTAHEKAYWAKGTQKDSNEGSKRGASGKPCRYGLNCARPGCRFKHPDKPGAICMGGGNSRDSHCVLPTQLNIRLTADGDILINDKIDTPDANQNKTDISSSKQSKRKFTPISEEYTLTAAVVCVEDNPRNIVAYVKIGDGDDVQWYLFNDLCIQDVSLEEVIQFGAWWKTPCVLFYTGKNVARRTDTTVNDTDNS